MIPSLPSGWQPATKANFSHPTPVIELEQITKFYGQNRGVDHLSLSVAAETIYGVLGPNGSGKTTTIRILLDLVRRDSGRVRVFGSDPATQSPDRRQHIGYLPGELGLPDTLSAGEALKYYGNLSGGETPLRDWILEVLDLRTEALGGSLRFFSKGMKQKVGLAQAIQHGPGLLILDEPTTGLDPVIQARLFAAFLALKRAGCTLFLSSHILSEVQAVCDSVVIMKHGRLAREGPVSQVLVTGNRRLSVARAGRYAGEPPMIEGAQLEQLVPDHRADLHWWHFRTTSAQTPDVLRSLAAAAPEDFRFEALIEESFLELYHSSEREVS